MPEELGESQPLEDREYDLSSRHVLTARILRRLAPDGPVLDIGGSLGLTQLVLPERNIVTIDIRPTGVDVVGSGAALPFSDGSFAAAVAQDVLEHVDGATGELLIKEAGRVADVVVFAGPYDDPAVQEAERHQRDLFIEMFGRDHPWLEEHDLPSRERTRELLERQGFETFTFGSNPLAVWSAQLFDTHIALRIGFDEKTRPTRRWLLETFLERADATAPSYRHFVVASRTAGNVRELLGDVLPGSNDLLVSEALRRTEISTASTIGLGTSVGEKIRAEASRGWAESVDRIHQLDNAALIAPDERLVRELESTVIAGGEWRSRLAGPVEHPGVLDNTMPDPVAYASWRSARVKPEPPEGGPHISIVTPVFNPEASLLTECIRSVRSQSYSEWELVLVDASDAPHVRPIAERFAALDSRIVIVSKENEGIAENTNAGVNRATGDWVAFLDHDDLLEEHALTSLALRIIEAPECDLVYSDEDKLDPAGQFVEPFFKPDWSPDLLDSVNYIAHLTAVRRDLFDQVGGMRSGFEGAQDYDFLLRAGGAARRIEHIPDVLYHWRQHQDSTALDVRTKPLSHSAGRRAVQEHARRKSPGSWVEMGAGATSHLVRYPLKRELVSIVIPFRDQAVLTDACLRAIEASAPELPIEVLLVSNQSGEPETAAAMERWERQWSWSKVLQFDEPFNFQRLNNWASQKASGPLLLFLNNDTEPLHNDWLTFLAENAQRPEVGAVGGRLFYPDGRVQHAGVAVGIGGFAEHPWGRLHPDAITPAGPSYWVRDVLAVTGACLMVEHEKFDRIGGFDERFEVCGGDVDLGIRLREQGWTNVMTPFCRVVHHEAATREWHPPENDIRESLRAYARYLRDGDPYYNRNLTLSDTTCGLVLQ